MRFIINFNIIYNFNESQAILKYSDSDYISDKQNQKLILKYIYIFKSKSVL